MIIKKVTLLMLTVILVFANAGEGSKQCEQIGIATEAVIDWAIGANLGSSDVKTQMAWPRVITGFWKTLE
jgi:hypothetical protein